MQSPECVVGIKGVNAEKILLLPITPDQPYHNNKEFSAILEYIEENNLHVILIIADRTLTLQMDGKHTPEAAALESETLIKDWKRVNLEEKNKDCYLRLSRNKQIEVYTIEEFDAKCKIQYKERYHEDFKGDDIVQEIYYRPCMFLSKSDAPRSIVDLRENYCDNSAESNKNNPSFKKQKALQLSQDYILNKCTSMYLSDSVGYMQMAYPININKTNQKIFNSVNSLRISVKKKSEPNNDSRMELLDLSVIKIRKTLETQKSRKNNPQDTKQQTKPPPLSPTKKIAYSRVSNNPPEINIPVIIEKGQPENMSSEPNHLSRCGELKLTLQTSSLTGYNNYGLLTPKNTTNKDLISPRVSPRSETTLSLTKDGLIDKLTTIEKRLVTAEYILESAVNLNEIKMAKEHLKTTREIVNETKQSISYSPPKELFDETLDFDKKTNHFH